MLTNISSKNLLQEYCQKQNIPIPIYNSSSDGLAHNIEWTIWTIFNKKIYETKASSKKVGEQKVAETILSELVELPELSESPQTNNNSAKSLPITMPLIVAPDIAHQHAHSTYNKYFDIENFGLTDKIIEKILVFGTIIFVDLENVNLTKTDIIIKPHILFIVISAKNCTKTRVQNFNVENIICNFVGRDVADVLLIFIVGYLYSEFRNKKIYIYTKDHYGDALGRIIHGKNICSIEEIIE